MRGGTRDPEGQKGGPLEGARVPSTVYEDAQTKSCYISKLPLPTKDKANDTENADTRILCSGDRKLDSG